MLLYCAVYEGAQDGITRTVLIMAGTLAAAAVIIIILIGVICIRGRHRKGQRLYSIMSYVFTVLTAYIV